MRISVCIILCAAYLAGNQLLPKAAVPAAPLRASEPAIEGTIVAPDKITALVRWVEEATRYELTTLPIVMSTSTETVRRLMPRGEYGAAIIAAEGQGKIYIDELYVDFDKPANASIIIHELTHYVQEKSGRAYACRGEREAEAYENQNKYLVEQGQRPIMDVAMIEKMKHCAI